MKTSIAGVPAYTRYVGTTRTEEGLEARFELPQAVSTYEDGTRRMKRSETYGRDDLRTLILDLARETDATPQDRADRLALIATLVKGYRGLGGTVADLKDKLGAKFATAVEPQENVVSAAVVAASRTRKVGQSARASRPS